MSRGTQVRLFVGAIVIATALAVSDLSVRLHRPVAPLPPASPASEIPPPDQLSGGAPFHTFSIVSSDYYTFRLHWLAVPLALLTTLALHGWLRRRRRGGLAAVAAGLLPAVLFLGWLEGALIEAVPRPLRFGAHPARVWTLRADLPPPGPGSPPLTDAEGFRLTPAGGSEGPLVLVLGDSTTFGSGMPRTADTYCWQLAEILARSTSGPAPRVRNRGVSGYTSWQGKLLLREILSRARPRVVVAGFMANDWTWGRQTDASLELTGLPGTLRGLLRTTRTYLFLEHLALASRQDERGRAITAAESGKVRVPVADFEANLEYMRQMCVRAQASILFLSLPMAPVLDARSEPYREAVMRVGSRPGAGCVNFYDEWKARGFNCRFFRPNDPVHPVEAGHREIARVLAARLLPLLGRRAGSSMDSSRRTSP